MDSLPSRKIKDNEDAQIMGIPLYILLIVIIAAVSLAAILGFMVTGEANINDVRIHELTIDGDNHTNIVCYDLHDDGRAFYDGWENPVRQENRNRPNPDSDTSMVVTAYDEEGNAMSGVDLEAEGAGVTSVATTNATGQAELSLEGCRLLQNQQSTQITVTATYEGMIGTESVQDTIWVQRP